MFFAIITVAICAAIVAICKMLFGIFALRDVPPAKRSEVIRAVGEAWGRWRR